MTTLQERARAAYLEHEQREEAKRQAARDLEAAQLKRLIRATLEMPDDSPEILWVSPTRVEIDGLQFGVDRDGINGYFLKLYKPCGTCGKQLAAFVYALEQLVPRSEQMTICFRCRKLATIESSSK